LFPDIKPYSCRLRSKGHAYKLPECSRDLYKKSFVPRCLFRYSYYLAMIVNVHILFWFSHCVSSVLLIIDFIVILHVRLIRVLLKINQPIN